MVIPSAFEYTADVRAHCRRFLLLLLMVALPVQAWAGASMLECAFAPGAAGSLAVDAADAMDHASHVDSADHGMHDGLAECDDTTAPAPVHGDTHDCKHCAACLVGATLPLPATQVALGLAAAQRYTPLSDAVHTAFFPDGPERPPRSHLA